MTVLIQPIDLFETEDGLFYYDGIEDTLFFERIPIDSISDTTAPATPELELE